MQKEKIDSLIGFCGSASPHTTAPNTPSATLAAFTANLPLDLLQSSDPLPGLNHTQTYFKLLGILPAQTVNLRALLPKNHPWQDVPWKAAQSWQGKAEKFLTDDFARHYQSMGYNISLVVNQGGTLAREITTAIAFFVEHDDRSQLESIGFLRECGLPEPTFRVNSGNKSVHHYWVLDEPTADIAEWQRIQRNLIALVQGDEHLRIPSFPMRLPGFYHVKTGKMATLFDVTGLKVSLEDIDAVCPQIEFTSREVSGRAEIKVGNQASAIASSKPDSLKWTNIDAMDLPFDVPIELKACLTKSHRDLIASGATEGNRRRMAVGLMKDLDGLFFLMDSIGQPISDDPWELLLEYAANCEPAWEEDDAARLYESEEGRSEGASLTGENLERCVRGSAWRKLKQIWSETNVKDSAVTLKKLNGKGLASDDGMDAIEVATAELFEESQCQDLSLVDVEIVGKGRFAKEKISQKSQSSVAYILKQEWKGLIAFSLESNSFYRYGTEKDGLWSKISRLEIETLVIKELEARGARDHHTSNYVEGITKLLRSAELVKEWDDWQELIPLENGVLDYKTRELRPHAPHYRFTWQLPFAYDPAAKCDEIIGWLMVAMQGQDFKVALCQAYLAAIVTSRSDLQMFLECVGQGGTGKSTFMSLAQALIGKENYYSVDLETLETNPFVTANIYRKKLITVEDSNKYFGGLSMLRKLTGNDSLSYNEKNIQGGKNFKYQGMVLISGNNFLQGNDHSDALGRRRLTIEFTYAPPEYEKRDLLSPGKNGEEWAGEFSGCLPGLLNWVLELSPDQVKKTLKEAYTSEPTQLETKMEVLRQTNTLAAWVFESTHWKDCDQQQKIGGAQKVQTRSINTNGIDSTIHFFPHAEEWLYANYCHWCMQNNKKNPISCQLFSKDLLNLTNGQLGQSMCKIVDNKGARINGISLTSAATEEANAHIGFQSP